MLAHLKSYRGRVKKKTRKKRSGWPFCHLPFTNIKIFKTSCCQKTKPTTSLICWINELNIYFKIKFWARKWLMTRVSHVPPNGSQPNGFFLQHIPHRQHHFWAVAGKKNSSNIQHIINKNSIYISLNFKNVQIWRMTFWIYFSYQAVCLPHYHQVGF